tara:strand:- start:95 stop:541 length:447 start_codon:yes stop_codon:yes gene_type:complete
MFFAMGRTVDNNESKQIDKNSGLTFLRSVYRFSFWPVTFIGNAILQFFLWLVVIFLFAALSEAKMTFFQKTLTITILLTLLTIPGFSVVSLTYVIYSKFKNLPLVETWQKLFYRINYMLASFFVLVTSIYLVVSRGFGKYLVIWDAKL